MRRGGAWRTTKLRAPRAPWDHIALLLNCWHAGREGRAGEGERKIKRYTVRRRTGGSVCCGGGSTGGGGAEVRE